jgi:hypothetical protein
LLPFKYGSSGVRSKIKQEDEKKRQNKIVTDPLIPSQKRKPGSLFLKQRPVRPRRIVSKIEG